MLKQNILSGRIQQGSLAIVQKVKKGHGDNVKTHIHARCGLDFLPDNAALESLIFGFPQISKTEKCPP